MGPTDLALNLLALMPTLMVAIAVLLQSKTVAAIVSMGDVFNRANKVESITTVKKKSLKEKLGKSKESVRDVDKLVFTGACVDMALLFFWMGRSPGTFYLWYTLNIPALITARYFLWRGKGLHFYLFDFCYMIDILGLIYAYVLPSSSTCFQLLFATANGPVALSVLAFNNSVVWHSFQHMISMIVHVAPMLLTLSIHWQDSDKFVTHEPGVSASPWAIVSRSIIYVYLPWVFVYYSFVFVYLGDTIKEKGYITLFDYVTKQALGKQLLWVPDSTDKMLVRKAAYLLVHVLFGTFTMFGASLMYNNFAAHCSYCIAICTAAAWNGAGFYGRVFSANYQFRNFNVELRKSLKRLSIAAERSNAINVAE